MRFAAETVPKPVRETVQPPVHVPTSVEAAPRLACELFSSVTASVSPAHACGTLEDVDLGDVAAVVDVAGRGEGRRSAARDRGAPGAELSRAEAEGRG